LTNSSQDNPKEEPDPAGGWSARIRQVKNALIVPSSTPLMVQPCGVFDGQGVYVDEAVLWRSRPLMVAPDRPEAQEHIPGHWIWGGVLLNHFGHFLTESTGRLWGVRPDCDGILFISKRGEPDEAGEVGLQAYHRLFFELLGIDLPIRVVTRPATVDVLDVPGQGFGIGKIATGTDEFRAFVAERFGKSVPAEGGELLYVSRSGLGAAKGGVLEETRIEAFLTDHGYEVFHPQKHSLAVQIARYKAARRIVALDGSALHLVAMLGKADQQVAVIRRRNSGAAESILDHLAGFMGHPPDVIDVIKRDWVRSDRRRADRFSIGELDFEALAARLVELGYVPGGATMAALTEDQARSAIAFVESRLRGGRLRFAPLGEPVPQTQSRVGKRAGPDRDRSAIKARRAVRRARRAAAKADASTSGGQPNP
jgi:hypothetical protein